MYNKYVIFQYLHWNDKHPRGTLVQVLGDVCHLDHFYEYQLYCKSLYASIQDFTKSAMKALRSKSEQFYIEDILNKFEIEDRRNVEVFSIDPQNSKDFDDQYHLSEMAIKRSKPVFTAFRNPDRMTRFEIEIQLMSPLDEW